MEQNEKYKNLSLKKKLFISHGFIIAVAASDSGTVTCGVKYCKGKCKRYF